MDDGFRPDFWHIYTAMILIHPPVSKPCEPPAGIARLAGMMQNLNIPVAVVDANLDGMLRAVARAIPARDTWTRRSQKNLQRNLAYLRGREKAWTLARYTRAVMEIHRMLEQSLESPGIRVSLGNYQDANLSPLNSRDLMRAAGEPEKNPFFPYFGHWLFPPSEPADDGHYGFSLNFLSQALPTFAMIGYLRRLNPRARIILGGGLVTTWLQRPQWKSPFGGLVDAMVAGPGESYVRGLYGAKTCAGHDRPCYDLFPLAAYVSPGLILPYSASSGCYWKRCLFCPEKAENNPYVPVAAERVQEDLGFLIERHQPVLVHFLDNAMSPALLQSLTARALQVPWYGFVRLTDHFRDPDFCRALKQSGCAMLKIGVESGDSGVLEDLQKGIDLETVSRALHNIKKAGIGTYLYFLFGTPPESLPEARQTLDFVKRHAAVIDFLNLAIFNMPAHGPDVGRYQTGEFYAGDLSMYASFEHPKGWHRDAVRSFLDNEFRRDTGIRRIIQRHPPFFTSNHAAFFLNSMSPGEAPDLCMHKCRL